jgi:hypothetical protein
MTFEGASLCISTGIRNSVATFILVQVYRNMKAARHWESIGFLIGTVSLVEITCFSVISRSLNNAL